MSSVRYHNLDYLRGLSAAGIMIYHYLSWTIGEFQSEDFMGRVGVYGVSIFYVLSGLTLYKVYFNTLSHNPSGWGAFYLKRILRIYPLMIVTILLSAWIMLDFQCSAAQMILNLTGLFGFVSWDTGIATGIWSIGNELCFYALFPILVYSAHKGRGWFLSVLGLSLLVYMVFAFSILHTDTIASQIQKRNYMNPLNQFFLFAGGFAIGHGCHGSPKKWMSLLLLTLGLILFIFLPAHGDRIHLITGWNRLLLTLACFVITIAFYSYNGHIQRHAARILQWLGAISYGMYLLHPLTHHAVGYVRDHHLLGIPDFSETIRLPLAIILTLIVSHFSYHYFELPCMRWARSNK
jgi:exopolysaccharide production protein ExoZ